MKHSQVQDIDVFSEGSSSPSCVDSHSDSDSGPYNKPKTPLNQQFKAAAPQEAAVSIDWNPSEVNYQQRVKRRQAAGLLAATLPQGFPSVAQGGVRWPKGRPDVTDILTHLSELDVAEIEQALRTFKNLGLSKDRIDRSTFPLPSLSATLLKMSLEVHDGNGVTILRGLDPMRYTFEDNIIIYAGIASHVGAVRGKQDRTGNILVHIKDVGSAIAPDHLRQSPYANTQQPFHNDLGDIIAMYCLDKAMTGGVTKLAPATSVYNDLAARRPDLIHELSAPVWAFDRNDGSQSYRTRPILFYDSLKDRVFFCFSRRQLTGSTVAPKPSYLPQLTEAQAEALDAVHFTAKKHALQIQLERGDIQFSNNLGLFHAREAFTDSIDGNKRHMVRMWLRNEELAWPTPLELKEVWQEIYGEGNPTWHLSPEHEYAHVINRVNSCHG